MRILTRIQSCRVWQFRAALAAGLAATFLFAGCAESRLARDRRSAAERSMSSKPPAFLTGPVSVLLTNAGNFSAYVKVEATTPANSPEGQLLSRDGRLLFARTPGPDTKKADSGGGFSFIWDVGANGGTLLSEALQGYAPIDGGNHFTGMMMKPDPAGAESVDGHPCQREQVSITTDGGTTTVYRVWRATDLKGLPIRIASMSAPADFTVSLSNVRFEVLPADLFVPPDGFSRYNNTEAMLNEITVRQHNIRRKEAPEPTEPEAPGQGPAAHYGGGY